MRSWAVSSWSASMISTRPASGPSSLGDIADDRHPIPQLDHERLEVEHDCAVLGAQRADIVVEDVDQLPVRLRDGRHPESLHARALEHADGGPVGKLPQPGRGRAGQTLLIGGELLLQRGRDVDVRVQRVDERRRDLVADLLVGDEVACGSRNRVGVEALEAHVAGEQAHQGKDHSEHGKDARGDHSHQRFIAREAGVSITPMG